MSIQFKIDAKILKTKIKEAEEKLNRFTSQVIDETAEQGLNLIKFTSPRKTGAYADSWVIENITEKSVTIGNTKEVIARVLEFGSTAHVIPGNPILRWEEGGQEFFAKYVNHPGTNPMPHIRPAREILRQQMPETVKRKLREAGIMK
jgi:hypothetical protein